MSADDKKARVLSGIQFGQPDRVLALLSPSSRWLRFLGRPPTRFSFQFVVHPAAGPEGLSGRPLGAGYRLA